MIWKVLMCLFLLCSFPLFGEIMQAGYSSFALSNPLFTVCHTLCTGRLTRRRTCPLSSRSVKNGEALETGWKAGEEMSESLLPRSLSARLIGRLCLYPFPPRQASDFAVAPSELQCYSRTSLVWALHHFLCVKLALLAPFWIVCLE